MKFIIFSISIIEGFSLMATEIIAGKIVSPYFGNSLKVWTSNLIIVFFGLAIGYFIGGKVSSLKYKNTTLLKLILCLTLFQFTVVYFYSNTILNYFINYSIEIGSILSFLVLFFPLFTLFGIVSPLIISYFKMNNAGYIGGVIFSISTLSGLISTNLFGLCIIPIIGIKFSISLLIIITLLSLISSFFLNENNA